MSLDLSRLSQVSAYIHKHPTPFPFLSDAKSLKEVITEDGAMLQRLGVTHNEVAEALTLMITTATCHGKLCYSSASQILYRVLGQDSKPPVPDYHMKTRTEFPQGSDWWMLEAGDWVAQDWYVRYALWGGTKATCPFCAVMGEKGKRPSSSSQPKATSSSSSTSTAPTKPPPKTPTKKPFLPPRPRRPAFGGKDFIFKWIETDEELLVSDLMPHMIREHHFFGGGTPYRLDPLQFCKFLGILKKPAVTSP